MLTKDEQLELLIEQYYSEIYRYCFAKLEGNQQGAEDCTQDVFLLFTEKRDILDLSGQIRAWLYKSAGLIIRNYKRRLIKNDCIPIDELSIPDPKGGGLISLLEETPLDHLRAVLSEEDIQLLSDYYSAKHGERKAVAAKYGLTLAELYDQIERIKRRISV